MEKKAFLLVPAQASPFTGKEDEAPSFFQLIVDLQRRNQIYATAELVNALKHSGCKTEGIILDLTTGCKGCRSLGKNEFLEFLKTPASSWREESVPENYFYPGHVDFVVYGSGFFMIWVGTSGVIVESEFVRCSALSSVDL